MASKDIKVGDKYNFWEVIEFSHFHKGRKYWLCRCECGTTKAVACTHLILERSKSCGCYRKSVLTKHGMSDSRLYHIWNGMIERCKYETNISYPNYGGMGIEVCDEWLESSAFIKWAFENGYSEKMTLDRIDVNKGYSPDNCRWTDIITQANNKKNNVLLTVNGETHTCAEWSRITGISTKNICYRLKAGWNPEDIVYKKVRKT